MTRMVSQILWEHCMGELGYGGNDYENDTFTVRSYDWVGENNNEWHFWHKPSGLKVQWYKYPLRGFKANMEITDDQFLDVLRDCTNSMEDGKSIRFLHDIRRWWADHKTEPQSLLEAYFKMRAEEAEQTESQTEEPDEMCQECKHWEKCFAEDWRECRYTPKDEQTEPKCGEWIDMDGYEVCKNCHEVKRFPHWNFCPNCGAKMKGE